MAEETKTLIDNCTGCVVRAERAVKEGSPKSLESAIKRMMDRIDAGTMTNWDGDHKTIVTERTFFKNFALTVPGVRIADLEKAVKALDAKVKVKNVLNIFKTQKMLDDAKATLKTSQDKLKECKAGLQKNQELYNKLDRTVQEVLVAAKQAAEEVAQQVKKITQLLKKLDIDMKKVRSPEEWKRILSEPINQLNKQVAATKKLKSIRELWAKVAKDNFYEREKPGELHVKLKHLRLLLDKTMQMVS